MRNDCTFETIVKETAQASFHYEHEFATETETVEEPSWYENVKAFTLVDSEDVDLYSEQVSVIEEALSPIEKSVKEIGLDVLPNMRTENEDVKIVFSVMLRTNDNDKPMLAYIKL